MYYLILIILENVEVIVQVMNMFKFLNMDIAVIHMMDNKILFFYLFLFMLMNQISIIILVGLFMIMDEMCKLGYLLIGYYRGYYF
jgi:hypothetical protein